MTPRTALSDPDDPLDKADQHLEEGLRLWELGRTRDAMKEMVHAVESVSQAVRELRK